MFTAGAGAAKALPKAQPEHRLPCMHIRSAHVHPRQARRLLLALLIHILL